MAKDVIPNWTIFGAYMVSVELYAYPEDDGKTVYNSRLSFFLDDGKVESFGDVEQDEMLVVSVVTNYIHENPYICALNTAEELSNMFPISDNVFVLNREGEITAEFSLRDAEKELNMNNQPVLH